MNTLGLVVTFVSTTVIGYSLGVLVTKKAAESAMDDLAESALFLGYSLAVDDVQERGAYDVEVYLEGKIHQ